MKQRLYAILLAIVATGAVARDCWPWGATGHEWVSGIAIEKLTDSLPEFIRTPEVAAEIAVLGRELEELDEAFEDAREAVLLLEPVADNERTITRKELTEFVTLVQAGFKQPRKKLVNSLAEGLGTTKQEAMALLAKADIDPEKRPQNVAVADWVRLYRSA